MSKRWRIHPHDPDRIAALERAAGIPAVVAQLLICRGITDPDAARTFLDPKLSALRDPQLLPGCTEAVRLMHQAIAARRRIVIYGDYDVDGVTGTAILWLCLKMLGAEVELLCAAPHRGRIRTERRGRPLLGRRQGGDAGHGRLRHRRRGRGRPGPPTRPGVDHHRSPRAAGRNCPRRRPSSIPACPAAAIRSAA